MSSQAERTAQFKEVLEARFGEVFAFRQALTQETDRGCALLAASYLDTELEHVLVQSLVDDPKVAQDLLRASGPLGSFSTRIDLAYLIGLIGPLVHKDLNVLRKVRNEFGHSTQPITFEEPSIASRCREIQQTYLDSHAAPRRRFTSSVLGVMPHLHAARFRAKHISARGVNHESRADKAHRNPGGTEFESQRIGEGGDAERSRLVRQSWGRRR